MARVFRPIVGNVFVLICLAACVMPVRVGGYSISGVVLDESTELPIKGARVYGYFSRSSFYGPPEDVVIGYAFTDESGRFELQADAKTLLGGTGGWSGRISRVPSFDFEKRGYCKALLISRRPVSRSDERRKSNRCRI